jgi:hypothetical protein
MKEPAMPSENLAKIISLSVVPVVIISACGLLCLAFYNRLAAIVSRLRAFQRERLREEDLLRAEDAGETELAARRRKLLHILETQVADVTRRAKLIRLTLFFLLLTIALLIGCCMMLGASVVAQTALYLAVPLFMAGLLTMLSGIVAAMFELRASLAPAELEHRLVSMILHEED